jgi:sec-independent protein translocase protein TatC
LEELRKRLKVVIIALIVSTAFFLIFPANPQDLLNTQVWLTGFFKPVVSLVLVYIKSVVAPGGIEIISLQIGAPLEIYMLGSLMLGLIVSSPIIAYEIYKFVDPALHPHERRGIYGFVTAFVVLFLGGALFGLFVLGPFIVWTLDIFSGFVGALPIISVADFYTMIFITIIFCGVAFTFPAVIVLLVKMGIISTSLFTKNRLYLYPIIYIITAIITPDGGPLADLALFIPVIVMMEIALLISKRYERQSTSTEGSIATAVAGYEGKCKYCGAEIGREKIFCPRCGKSKI